MIELISQYRPKVILIFNVSRLKTREKKIFFLHRKTQRVVNNNCYLSFVEKETSQIPRSWYVKDPEESLLDQKTNKQTKNIKKTSLGGQLSLTMSID